MRKRARERECVCACVFICGMRRSRWSIKPASLASPCTRARNVSCFTHTPTRVVYMCAFYTYCLHNITALYMWSCGKFTASSHTHTFHTHIRTYITFLVARSSLQTLTPPVHSHRLFMFHLSMCFYVTEDTKQTLQWACVAVVSRHSHAPSFCLLLRNTIAHPSSPTRPL